jgi:FG-GAP-like repeat/Abnormal spindle-like microcephaly-assoc'd, ASPM-SPD-2-Hydin
LTRTPIFPLSLALAAVCALTLNTQALAQFENRGASAALPGGFAYSAAVGDFNHDGNLDLAVASIDCCPNGGVSILLGNGDGTFQAPVQYAVGDQPFSIVAADFNHDGNLDLAVANSLSDYVSILMGNGDGTFQPATQTPPVSNPDFVTVGDFNGDGKPDLLVLSYNNPCKCISVLFGNGDGTFQNAVITEPPFSVLTVGVGDFNGDGKLDLATAGEVGSERYVNILLGNGDGTFTQGASYAGDASPESIAVADFNGDHNLDFAVANLEGVGIGVWLGNGDGTFQPAVNYATPFPWGVSAAPLKAGGNIDLVASNFGASGDGATVFEGNGDGTFQPGVFYPAGGEDWFVGVGDFNGDRKPDLILTNGNSDDVILLLNTGVVSFSPTTPLNFAKQAVGTTSASQSVKLTNTGTTELRIQSMKASTEFAVTSTCGERVAPGVSCTISATFSPTKQGARQGTITIIDNASTKPQVIELLGTGT